MARFPAAEADDVFICVGVFIHWDAADDKKIHDYNYQAVKELIERAVNGKPTPAEVVSSARRRQASVQPLGGLVADRVELSCTWDKCRPACLDFA